MMLALNWLRLNWKLVAVIAFVFSWSLFCYNAGRRAVIAEWQAEKAAQILTIQAEKDRLQDEANQKSKELEATISKLEAVNRKLNQKVRYAIKKNDSYAKCIVDDAGLQLFNQSTGSSNATK